jgi:alkylhydroperoxidase family enzyme
VPIAKAVGASDDQVAALESDEPEADSFSADQRAVLRFTTEVLHDARPSNEAFEAISAILSPREIVELLMVIGQYMMVARVMATTEIEIDGPVDPNAVGGPDTAS